MWMLIKEEKIAKIKEQTIKSDAIIKSKKFFNQNTHPIEVKLKTKWIICRKKIDMTN